MGATPPSRLPLRNEPTKTNVRQRPHLFLRPNEETRIPRNLPPPRRLLPQEERLLPPRNPQPLRRTQRIKPTPRKAKKRNVGQVNRCLPPWKSRNHKLQNASRILLPNPVNGMDHVV